MQEHQAYDGLNFEQDAKNLSTLLSSYHEEVRNSQARGKTTESESAALKRKQDMKAGIEKVVDRFTVVYSEPTEGQSKEEIEQLKIDAAVLELRKLVLEMKKLSPQSKLAVLNTIKEAHSWCSRHSAEQGALLRKIENSVLMNLDARRSAIDEISTLIPIGTSFSHESELNLQLLVEISKLEDDGTLSIVRNVPTIGILDTKFRNLINTGSIVITKEAKEFIEIVTYLRNHYQKAGVSDRQKYWTSVLAGVETQEHDLESDKNTDGENREDDHRR